VLWESGKLLTTTQTMRLSLMTRKERARAGRRIAKRWRKQAHGIPASEGGAATTSPTCELQVRLSCEYPAITTLKENLRYPPVVNLSATFEMLHDLHQLERSTRPQQVGVVAALARASASDSPRRRASTSAMARAMGLFAGAADICTAPIRAWRELV
jgi:hypothetical protein